MIRFCAVSPFDISQPERESLPEIERVSGDPGAHTERGIALEMSDQLGTSDGASAGGRILIKPAL